MSAIDLFWILVAGSAVLIFLFMNGNWFTRTQEWSGQFKRGIINKNFDMTSPNSEFVEDTATDRKLEMDDQLKSSEEFNKRFDK